MKRILFVLLAALLMFSLCACNNGGDESNQGSAAESESNKKEVSLDLEAEADAIIQKYSISGGKRYSSESTKAGEYLDEDLIRSYYGDLTDMPNFDEVEAYAVYIDESKPIHPCEFGIFKMKDGADTKEFMLYLKARIDLKIENAKAYPTMDTEPLKTATFTEKDGYIWYSVVKGGNSEINETLGAKFE